MTHSRARPSGGSGRAKGPGAEHLAATKGWLLALPILFCPFAMFQTALVFDCSKINKALLIPVLTGSSQPVEIKECL